MSKSKKTPSKTLSKAGPIDGYGPYEKRKIRNALRQIWQRSKARKIAKDRCINADGYEVCEECGKQVPKITVDHIIPIGDIEEEGFLERLMVDSSGLKCLCEVCHRIKTKEDVKNINKGKEERAKLKATVTRHKLDEGVVVERPQAPFSIEAGALNFVKVITVDDLI